MGAAEARADWVISQAPFLPMAWNPAGLLSSESSVRRMRGGRRHASSLDGAVGSIIHMRPRQFRASASIAARPESLDQALERLFDASVAPPPRGWISLAFSKVFSLSYR
jgi:hypothetical protein